MKITPLDIRRKEFKRSVRGYSDEEVDIFLDEVADEFERIFQENMELQDRAHRLNEQIAGHQQLKDALEKTLISAQLQSEELRANAHKESELILRDAELKAHGIVSASYGETQRTQQALVQLKLLEEDFRFKFRSLLEGYLRLLNEAPLAVTGPEAAAVAGAAGAAAGASAGAAEAAAGVPVAAEEAPVEPAPAAPAEEQPYEPEPMRIVAEPPLYAPEPPVYAAEPQAFIPEPPAYVPPPPAFEERWPASTLDEDTPTEESPAAEEEPAVPEAERPSEATYRAAAGAGAGEDVTAETGLRRGQVADDASQEVEAPRGFFFGRRLDDVDDTFPGEDGIKKDRTRDFEW